jgi:hypothetical protein
MECKGENLFIYVIDPRYTKRNKKEQQRRFYVIPAFPRTRTLLLAARKIICPRMKS